MPANPNKDDENGSPPKDAVDPDGVTDSETFEAVESTETVDTGEWEQIHQAHYDREGELELATALAFAIADARGVDPVDAVEMPPLYESFDAEALEETFFGPGGADTDRDEVGEVTFRYDGLRVALRSDGWIFVYRPL